jgi:hypothetical protein
MGTNGLATKDDSNKRLPMPGFKADHRTFGVRDLVDISQGNPNNS